MKTTSEVVWDIERGSLVQVDPDRLAALVGAGMAEKIIERRGAGVAMWTEQDANVATVIYGQRCPWCGAELRHRVSDDAAVCSNAALRFAPCTFWCHVDFLPPAAIERAKP